MLPSGYVQLEYIQSSGTQWIDTGVVPGYLNFSVNFTGKTTSSVSSEEWFFTMNRARPAGTATFLQVGTWSSLYAVHLTYVSVNGQDAVQDAIKTYSFSVTGNVAKLVVDTEYTTTHASFFTGSYRNSQISLFGYNILCTGCTIIVDGVLMRDFVPCKNPSGVVGLYDVVNDAFYGNVGTGTFIAGPALAPDPPTNLTGAVSNKTVYLSWNASSSGDVTGYRVYIDGDLVGTTTSLSYFHVITPSQNHSISVTAYNDSGESDPVSISVYYELPNSPTNLDATFDEGIVHLIWTDSTTEDVTGYRIYQNGVLVTTTPAVFSLFEFPFSNESLTENLLELSSLERVQFYQSIEPYTNYTFSVVAFNKYGESDPVSINVYYETTPDIISVSLIPNPVFTEESLTISVSVDQLYNVTIT